MFKRVFFAMALLLLWNCGGEEERLKMRRDIANLQEQIYELERIQAELRRDVQQKLQDVNEKVTDRTVQADTQEQIYSLRESLSQFQALMNDLESKVAQLSRTRTEVAAATDGPDTGDSAVPDKVSGDVIEQQFIQASLDLDRGKYDVAILGFEEILKNFPGSPFTERSHYFLGRAHFEKKDYPNAVTSFRTITSQFPNGDFIKQAMYYEGQCYYFLNQYSKAINTLRDLIDRHQGTQEAELARQFLKRAGYER